MFGFLWDLHQQNRLRELDDDTSRAREAARDGTRVAEELKVRIDRLELICAALGSLLQEHAGVTSAAIEQRVRELDLQDGKLDGKMSSTTKTCLKCGRAMSGTRGWCMYCGVPDDGP
jgi:hypothetical protein